MKFKDLKQFIELCKLLGIKTMADLKTFEDSHNLIAPNGDQLITALEKEIFA